MRDQGRLTEWNDEKGFGFVTPETGGQRAFVHIRAFSYRTRRPRQGDVITYQVGWDDRGRPRAENVLFREGRKATAPVQPARGGDVTSAVVFATAFLFCVTLTTLAGKLPWFAPVVYLVASFLTFCAYLFDKSAAMNRRWRTPEQTLHLMSLLGGWPGALIAQRAARHKSRKPAFQFVFWSIALTHCAALAAIWMGWRPEI